MAHANNTSFAASASLSETDFEMVQHTIYDIPYGPHLKEPRLSERSIYKVPSNLRKVNEEAYTPQCMSIGPMHFDLYNEELMPMQEHKKWYFDFFWKRVSDEQAMRAFKDYLETKEKEIQQCYVDQNFHSYIGKEELVDIMLLDVVFIMELLLRNSQWKSLHSYKHEQTESIQVRCSDDLIFIHSWLGRIITRDLILLENQIPFFVLQKLYDDVVPGDNKKEEHTAGFVDLAIEYFAIFYDTQMSSDDETKKHYFSVSLCVSGSSKSKSKNRYAPKHFTDLIRYVYLPNHVHKSGCARHVLRTVTKLQESGVSFEKGDVKRRLLDITFDKTPILSLFLCFGCLPFFKLFKARLRIPQLKVDHTTECVFRNLIAFEQCHYPDKPYICNYVSLIDSLIHTHLDMELLVEKEVIVHELKGEIEVLTLINGLSKLLVTNSTCYYETINKLNEHCMSNWNHTIGTL